MDYEQFFKIYKFFLNEILKNAIYTDEIVYISYNDYMKRYIFCNQNYKNLNNDEKTMLLKIYDEYLKMDNC